MLFDEQGKQFDKDILADRDIIMYGASLMNRLAIAELNIKSQVIFFVDSDENKDGTTLDGYTIRNVTALDQNKDSIVLSVVPRYSQPIAKAVHDHGISKCIFYIPDEAEPMLLQKINAESLPRLSVSYKYIHIFPDIVFGKHFYEMLEHEFDLSEHLIIIDYKVPHDRYGVMSYYKEKTKINHNILFLVDFFGKNNLSMNHNEIFECDQVKSLFANSTKIIFHSAFWCIAGECLAYDLVNNYPDKTTWLCWGGDAILDDLSIATQKIIKSIKHIFASEAEVSTLKKYHITARKIVAFYSYIYNSKQTPPKETPSQKKLRILLGHSAAGYGNHEYGMRLLSKYKDADIEIYSPLSYGEVDYRERVITKGKELFGHKFHPMLTFMDPSEYYNFLQTIDVAVFPMTRMAAGTTIKYLSTIGTPIYMREDMIGNFAESEVVKNVFPIENLSSISFAELRNIQRIIDEDAIFELDREIALQWNNLFNLL